MSRPRIVAVLRIKNVARWIRRTLESIRPLADAVVILDDGSTDETAFICRSWT